MSTSYTDTRQIFDRRHGPAIGAAGDGQEGTYTGVLHTAVSNGQCQVIIPALGLTRWRTANVAPYVNGAKGDTCVVQFDEQKIPWVISAQSLAWTPTWHTPTFVNSWTGSLQYTKDPFGRVQFKGAAGSGASGTVVTTLPAGFRSGVLVDSDAYWPLLQGSGTAGAFVNIPKTGVITATFTVVAPVYFNHISYLAEN